MFGYKVDDATIVRMVKIELLDLAKEHLIPLDPMLESDSQSSIYYSQLQNQKNYYEIKKINTRRIDCWCSYVPGSPKNHTQTKYLKCQVGSLLKSKSDRFKRSILKSDAREESMVTEKVWFERLKSRLLTVNYAQSLQRFLTVKTVTVFRLVYSLIY